MITTVNAAPCSGVHVIIVDMLKWLSDWQLPLTVPRRVPEMIGVFLGNSPISPALFRLSSPHFIQRSPWLWMGDGWLKLAAVAPCFLSLQWDPIIHPSFFYRVWVAFIWCSNSTHLCFKKQNKLMSVQSVDSSFLNISCNTYNDWWNTFVNMSAIIFP